MSISGIQGLPFEVTVVGCYNLVDKEWISRQDPYVCIEYGSAKYRTKTCTDGGKNPIFQEKFVFSLIEGLRELNVVVWNSNTLVADDLIGSGRVQLHKVLSQGFDDCAWPLQSKTGRYSGEVRLIMHFANATAQKYKTKLGSLVPEYAPYGYPPAATAPPPPYPATMPLPYAVPSPSTYPPPPTTATYPPTPYGGYPPQPPAAAYPPAGYPPQPQTYPPPPQPSTYYPPTAPTGIWPPPPY